jgi:hypothetical protein
MNDQQQLPPFEPVQVENIDFAIPAPEVVEIRFQFGEMRVFDGLGRLTATIR